MKKIGMGMNFPGAKRILAALNYSSLQSLFLTLQSVLTDIALHKRYAPVFTPKMSDRHSIQPSWFA